MKTETFQYLVLFLLFSIATNVSIEFMDGYLDVFLSLIYFFASVYCGFKWIGTL